MLFSDKKKHNLSIPATDDSDRPTTVASLVTYLCKNVMKDQREEMFVLDGHVLVIAASVFTPFRALISKDVLEYWYSSTMRTGNSKEKKSTKYNLGITFSSSLRYTADNS